MSKWLTLPVELWLMIAEDVLKCPANSTTPLRDLQNLRCTHSFFLTITEPLLFKDICVDVTLARQLLRQLLDNTRLCKLVQRLALTSPWDDYHDPKEVYEMKDEDKEQPATFCSDDQCLMIKTKLGHYEPNYAEYYW